MSDGWDSSPCPGKQPMPSQASYMPPLSHHGLWGALWHMMKACVCTPPYLHYKCFGFLFNKVPQPHYLSHLKPCENTIHMQAETGTVPNMIAVSLLSGGHRGRGGWAAWVERTVPFLKHGAIHLCAFNVLSQRSESVPHEWYFLWKSPHD